MMIKVFRSGGLKGEYRHYNIILRYKAKVFQCNNNHKQGCYPK